MTQEHDNQEVEITGGNLKTHHHTREHEKAFVTLSNSWELCVNCRQLMLLYLPFSTAWFIFFPPLLVSMTLGWGGGGARSGLCAQQDLRVGSEPQVMNKAEESPRCP